MSTKLLISCEHAGNDVPEEYEHLFAHDPETLQTHRGIDIGALKLTNTIADELGQEPYVHTITRLLVDLNRSVQSPTLFSEFTEQQPIEIREDIFTNYYRPHRQQVEERIQQIIDAGNRALHVGIHTFTPIWEGKQRDVDIGFLFDPTRTGEQEFCGYWRKAISEQSPRLRLRMNQPYRGTMDGFTTYLRRKYQGDDYIGMEIEVNQKFAHTAPVDEWKHVQQLIAVSLRKAFEIFK
jgi:predicted N-formylglutamate amidohydrolase